MSWIQTTKDVDVNDPAVKKLFDEAMAAAPIEYTKSSIGDMSSSDPVGMLSRIPIWGRCRLCGKESELTKEHIPPRSSGNKQRHTKLTFNDWLKDRMEENADTKHQIEQGGLFGYTICKKCNSLTGKLYGTEYKNWVKRAEKIISDFNPGTIGQLNQSIGPFGLNVIFGSKESGSVKPGAFIRQILSCMCSLSGSWDLANCYPEIRRIVLDQSTERLPKNIELGMSLYFGPRMRICGPQLKIDAKEGVWRWCQEIAFPPFAFLLVVLSNKENPGLGLLINEFTALSPGSEQYFDGLIEMGFGWSPYPGDYRSQGTIIVGRRSA